MKSTRTDHPHSEDMAVRALGTEVSVDMEIVHQTDPIPMAVEAAMQATITHLLPTLQVQL
jgi:hypothetical protein